MRNWNVLVTVLPTRGGTHALLGALSSLGEFHGTSFKDVCVGRVEDQEKFFGALLDAMHSGKRWFRHVGRVVPIAHTFQFTVESLVEQLTEAVTQLAREIRGGTCFVRLERRGLHGEVHTTDLEHAVADHLFSLVQAQGGSLRTSFHDPDYIFVAETLGNECGVGLITRDLRARFPFIRVR